MPSYARSIPARVHNEPPIGLILDQRGNHFDPAHPSDLETLLATGPDLRSDQIDRARHLIEHLIRNDVSKYNLGGSITELPDGYKILVPGQVEDDASIKLGCPDIATNLELLRQTRAMHPDATILYKPHPDVVAGLRQGHISDADLGELADVVISHADISTLLSQVDSVHTLTSLPGFEALLRGCDVTVYGQPFYSG